MKAEDYIKETLKQVNNEKEVLQVIGTQMRVKADLDDDAMTELKPYLEQGP